MSILRDAYSGYYNIFLVFYVHLMAVHHLTFQFMISIFIIIYIHLNIFKIRIFSEIIIYVHVYPRRRSCWCCDDGEAIDISIRYDGNVYDVILAWHK